jgi:hypothetical protein
MGSAEASSAALERSSAPTRCPEVFASSTAQHRSARERGDWLLPARPPIPGSRTAGSNAGSSGWTEHPGELLRAGGRCRWSGRCAATSACVPHNQCLSRGSLTDRPDSDCRTAGFNARSSGWTEHPGALLRAGACCRWSGRCAPTPAGVPHNQCLSWGSLTDRPDSGWRSLARCPWLRSPPLPAPWPGSASGWPRRSITPSAFPGSKGPISPPWWLCSPTATGRGAAPR